ncbi:hypothetical protein GCM10027598_65690 [Amycolatopsis oliviviridis]|uniref:Uncharacterized protein n=1 Tax=Amycolatopsis oliviviridis TaxID=1471590 RepID=A0ABQ3MC42_9PSEU|nr:hypothetical protein GCM10017790_79290 [Amycolatopsis oliviviridis]
MTGPLAAADSPGAAAVFSVVPQADSSRAVAATRAAGISKRMGFFLVSQAGLGECRPSGLQWIAPVTGSFATWTVTP